MTTIKALRLASLVTAINVLVASGFSILAIMRAMRAEALSGYKDLSLLRERNQ